MKKGAYFVQYISPVFVARRSHPWFLSLFRTCILPQVWLIVDLYADKHFSLVWRKVRSRCTYCNLIYVPSWRWWLVGHPSSLQGLPSFLNNDVEYLDKPPTSSLNYFKMRSICTRWIPVVQHRENVTHFIHVWAFTA